MRRILIYLAFFAGIISLLSGCNSGSSSSSAPGGVNPGFPSDIQLVVTQYIVQTNSDVFFKARVLDGNGRPISGIPVTFTNISPIGTINAAKAVTKGSVTKSGTTVANTNSLGYATARVWSPEPGFVTVQAEVNQGTANVREKTTIYFSTYDFSVPVPVEPTPTLELAVDGEDADVIFNETEDFNLFETPDDDEVLVEATVLDGNGDPAPSVVVTFGADSTEASFPEGSSKTTDLNGKAQVRVLVAPALKNLYTNLNITASATVNDVSASNMITLFLPPIVIFDINLNATPSQVAPSGTSTIDAYVTTSAGGTAPDGTTVNFTTTCGFVIPFAQTTGGLASSTFTAPASFGTCTITGTAAGVSDSVDVIVSDALFVTPSTQTISAPAVGNTATYTIMGGTAPYTAYSSNPGLVTVVVAGSVLTATVAAVPAADTTVTITIYDSVSDSDTATLVLDVAPVSALTVIPSTQTISAPAVGNTATYTIIGGTAPYTAYSSNPGLVTVSVVSSTLTATVAAVPTTDTTVTLTVYDNAAASATVTLLLDVISTPLKVIPSAQTKVPPFTTADYTVTGGIGPYTAFSNNPGLVTVPAGTFAGPTLTATIIAAPSVDTTVTITIYDSAGSSVSASLVLDVAAVSPLSVTPSSITVTGIANPDSDDSDNVIFTITGGTGSYSMYSSNGAIIASQGLLGGSTFTVDPDAVAVNTTVTITVQDSVGNTDTSTVTVTPPTSSFRLNPIAVTILEGDSVTIYISGGIGPYETFTTDPGACVPAPGGGSLPNTATSFVVNPGAGCSVGSPYTITLIDSIGNTASVVITVGADTTPPIVISTTPLPGATGVVLDSPVTINWNEGINCATVNTASVTIVPMPTTWVLTSCGANSATFTPTGQTASTLYTVFVGVGGGVFDTSGNQMFPPISFSYTTAP
jgi:hypothetical protein